LLLSQQQQQPALPVTLRLPQHLKGAFNHDISLNDLRLMSAAPPFGDILPKYGYANLRVLLDRYNITGAQTAV
jgi:hypothetical protein